MPVPVVQKELIWDVTCESLSLLAPIPWVYPLGAVPRWAGVGGHNTSRSCRRAAMVGHALPPFRSVKNNIFPKMHPKRSPNGKKGASRKEERNKRVYTRSRGPEKMDPEFGDR